MPKSLPTYTKPFSRNNLADRIAIVTQTQRGILKEMLRGVLFLLFLAGAATTEHSLAEYRVNYETRLRGPKGYLSVSGLWWLKEGDQRAGSDPALEIVLPARAPKLVGTFHLANGKVTFLDPKAPPKELIPDTNKKDGPTILPIDDMELLLIERNGRNGLRLRDPQSKMRREFKGVRWYPPDPKWRIEARFIAYKQPKTVLVPDVTGNRQQMIAPGEVEFKVAGRAYRLEPTLDDGNLFFVFHDKTAGHATYGAGRFLDTLPPKDGKVVLDFNEAYNPPCAFTPFATCPLPLKRNFLPIEIPAGELAPEGH